MQFRKSKLSLSAVTITCGLIISLLSGLLENLFVGGTIGSTCFGYPWAWRFNIIHATSQNIYRFDNLVADIAFWTISCFIVLIAVERYIFTSSETKLLNNKKLVLFLVLLVPLGLLMSLIHEVGHAFWGTIIGGTLTHLQIAFFVIYPKLTIVSQFKLGSVIVTGLSTSTQRGFFLLAGSLTTNIAAWLIGLLINIRKLGYRTRLSSKIFGYFGILDLPLYIIFPSLGLRHWIILGGTSPEPLIGARMLGIPDTIFYLLVVIVTLTLILSYSKYIRTRLLGNRSHG